MQVQQPAALPAPRCGPLPPAPALGQLSWGGHLPGLFLHFCAATGHAPSLLLLSSIYPRRHACTHARTPTLQAAERDYDLNRAAELKYGTLLELQKQLKEAEAQLEAETANSVGTWGRWAQPEAALLRHWCRPSRVCRLGTTVPGCACHLSWGPLPC